MPYLDQTGLSTFWTKIKTWANTNFGATISKGTSASSGLPIYLKDKAATPNTLSTVTITKSDITALGIPGSDTKYTDATQTAHGLMSAADKKKLDGVEANANKYVHPTSAAGAKESGLYKVATDAQGHVTGATAVTKSDITALGIPGSQPTVTDEKVKTILAPDGTKFYLAGTENANGETGTLDISKQVYVESVGANTNILVSEVGIQIGAKGESLQLDGYGNITFPDGTLLNSDEYDGNAATANSASSVQWAGVKNVPSASTTTAGIVKLGTTAGTAAEGNHTHATKADLNSPTFTGTPKAPTAAADTNTTQIATTAFVHSKVAASIAGKQDTISDLATIRAGAAKGATAVQTETDPTVPAWAKAASKPSYTSDEIISTYADLPGSLTQVIDQFNMWNDDLYNKKAPLASPTFTGFPKAPTAAAGTNTTQIATTAFVQSAVAAASTGVAKYQGGMTAASYSKLTTYKAGWYWVVTEAGTIAGEACEVGDMVFCNTDNAAAGTKSNAHFDIVQNNIDAIPLSVINALS